LQKVSIVCRQYRRVLRSIDDVLGDIITVFVDSTRASERLQIGYFAFGKWQFDKDGGVICHAFYGV
jgi:hypothetical protein